MEWSLGKARTGDTWWHGPLLFALGAAWGLQLTLLKISAGSSLGELGILSLSMVLLSLIYLAVLAANKAWFRPTRRHLKFFVVSSTFGTILPMGGVLLIADHLSAGLIVLVSEALTPVFTVLIAFLLGTELLSARRLTAVALALAGVGLALWPALAGTSRDQLDWLLIFAVVPLAYAIDCIYVAGCWPQDLRAIQVVTGEAIAAAAMTLPFWLLLEGTSGLPTTMGPGEWAILAFVAVSFIEVYLYFYLLKTAGALFVSYGCFVSLFAGVLWGMSLLGETHPQSLWLAVALVCLGLYLITARRSA
ncbi:MAG: DMT family transporter [Pseudomonadota bacterium]